MASPLLKFLMSPMDVLGSDTRLIERMFSGAIPKTSTPVVVAFALAITWPLISGAALLTLSKDVMIEFTFS